MTSGLERYRVQRKDDICRRVETTLRSLDTAGEAITIARVAREAGVSRQWLYTSSYRIEIEQLRARHIHGGGSRSRSARERASEASLRSQNEVLRTRLKAARAETEQLRNELQRALGALRAGRPSATAHDP
ncbi:DUF6262 family protein [Kineococcus sp. NPDC059986]|uniref:DUF6262 family protein n=1 Tax=Kineococcus sp. NPDC059986 TaxID=3155538 RepID=UPI00344DA563